MNSPVIGIDFGTTGCKVATLDEYGRGKCIPNVEGDEVTPTLVAFENKETPVVGREAYRLALGAPEDILKDFKLQLGTKDVLYTSASGKTYRAVDLAEIVLRKLKGDAEQALGTELQDVVITCPANFQDDARQDLMQAAQQAGLRVQKLIPEPTAAAIAYGLQRGSGQTFMVFDLGGGTFDVTVAASKEDHIEVLGTSGVPRLGGRDFDTEIADYVLAEFSKRVGFRPDARKEPAFYEDLRERSEQAKLALSVREKVSVTLGARGKYGTVEVTRSTFEERIRRYIEVAVKTCGDLLDLLSLKWQDLQNVVLVGGGSRVPAVKAAVEQASGMRPSQDIDPIRAVSFGAAIQAAILSAGAGGTYTVDGRAIPAPKVVLRDVTAYAVGVKVDDANRGVSNTVIVPRHTPIPASLTDTFRLKYPDQTDAEIVLLEGNDGDPAERCLILGSMALKELPAEASLPKRLAITIDIDGNGRVSARGVDTISGRSVDMQIDYARGLMKSA